MILDVLTLALKNKYDTEFRDGVHVSDITLCPRKSMIRRLEPSPISIIELNYFTSGRAIHDAIATLAGSNPARFEIEKEIKAFGVIGHVDLYDRENNIPIECKSMRVKEVKEPKSHHVEQLKSYMAMLNSKKGVLLYQCLLNFDEKPFVEFEVEMTDEDIIITQHRLVNEASEYNKYLSAKTPMEAYGVIKNPTLNWLCNRCPYLARCQEIKN